MSRLGHFAKAGRSSIPPWYSPTCFFNRPIGPTDRVSADQTMAKMLANAMNYGNQSYSFYGYSGVGYGFANYPYCCSYNGTAAATYPIYYVRSITQPQNVNFQKVGIWYYSSGTDHVAGTLFNNLQSYCNNVPLPIFSKCPMLVNQQPGGGYNGYYTYLWCGGTDQSMIIWDLDTDLIYELYKLDNRGPADMQSAMSCTWLAQGGAVYPCSTSNAVLNVNWGHRATSIGAIGGLITTQDMRDVYAGKGLNHALAFASGINNRNIIAPAQREDGAYSAGNGQPTIPSGFPGAGGANPAYGVDYTTEGARFTFPPGTDFSGCTYPLSKAVALAIQKYGMINVDSTSGGVVFYFEDDRTAGSPYDLYGANAVTPWNRTATVLGDRTALNWNAIQAGSNNDPTVGALTGGQTVFNQLPWQDLVLLDPISS